MSDTSLPPMVPTIPPEQRKRRKTDKWSVRARHWAGIAASLVTAALTSYQAAKVSGLAGAGAVIAVIIGLLSNPNIARGKQ